MVENFELNDIQAPFENLDIYINKIEVQRFAAIRGSNAPEQTALSNVWEDLNWHNYTDATGEVGRIILFLRNQNFEDSTILFLTFHLRVTAKNETDKASIFAKTIQYLFDLIAEKCENGEIKDREGNKFDMPPYLYSKANFEGHF